MDPKGDMEIITLETAANILTPPPDWKCNTKQQLWEIYLFTVSTRAKKLAMKTVRK